MSSIKINILTLSSSSLVGNLQGGLLVCSFHFEKNISFILNLSLRMARELELETVISDSTHPSHSESLARLQPDFAASITSDIFMKCVESDFCGLIRACLCMRLETQIMH
jgi:hypothetical protein